MTAPIVTAAGPQVVILTGVSGSGKSTALRALEDAGFYCVDNLPIVFLEKLLELSGHTAGEVSRIALVVDAREGRFLELPQVKFVIDRSRTPAQVRWMNTRRFGLHYYFLKAKYLTLADADAFNEANYSKPDRRFILGSLVRYPRLGKYGVELWEGDIVEPSLLTAMMERLQASFHAPLTFKPNSGQQEEAARAAGLATKVQATAVRQTSRRFRMRGVMERLLG